MYKLHKVTEEFKNSSPSFESLRFPKPQIFVEILCTNLQSPVWSRHIGGVAKTRVKSQGSRVKVEGKGRG